MANFKILQEILNDPKLSFELTRRFLKQNTTNGNNLKALAQINLWACFGRKHFKVEICEAKSTMEHLQFGLVFHRPIRMHTLETECVSARCFFLVHAARLQIMMPSFSRQSISHPAERARSGGVVVDYLTAGCTSDTL